MSFLIDWIPPSAIVQRFRGHVDDAELSESFRLIMGDARFDDLRFNVVDLTFVASTAVSDSVMELMAATVHGARLTNSRVTTVVIAPHRTGLALMEQFNAPDIEGYPTELVQSYESANRVLATRSLPVRFSVTGELVQVVPGRL